MSTAVDGVEGCPMFAPAYMGRKRMLLLHSRTVLSGQSRLQHTAKAFEGATPRRFRPTYAGANVGHPRRPSTHGVRIECSWRNSRCYHNLDRNLRLSQLSISMKSAQPSPLLP